ncbi:MAG TPA: hypothetical protein VG826_32880 [Pirellulales bacterium]|nr:hypothetical protein [Pirellulales bacterium]
MERGGSKYIFFAWLLATAPFLGALSGCGQSSTDEVAVNPGADGETDAVESPSSPAEAGRDAAAEVVQQFLQAIKTGDDTKSNDLLTPLARQKTAEMDMAVAPMGSDSASFTVGQVELPEDGGGELAHVESTWTDIDDDGQPRTDEILWVLRLEEQGWRIAGMATKVFEDQPPLLLNFEDPSDMRRKQQLAEAEMERRAREAARELPDESLQAQEAEVLAARPAPPQRQAAKTTRPQKKK